jgi:hypothetical protein
MGNGIEEELMAAPYERERTTDALHLSEMETRPIAVAAVRSAVSFNAYCVAHHLQALDISLRAKVRYFTVWNILHGIPVQGEHAALVRQALYKMTGVVYREPIHVYPDAPELASIERTPMSLR